MASTDGARAVTCRSERVVVGFKLAGEVDDVAGEADRFAASDDPVDLVAGVVSPGCDRGNLLVRQRAPSVDAEVDGAQQRGERVPACGALTVH